MYVPTLEWKLQRLSHKNPHPSIKSMPPPKPDPPTPPPTLALRLKAHLSQIHYSPCPTIPNPPTCKKRASVALIIRIRPTYPHRATYDPSLYQPLLGGEEDLFQLNLDTFFEQTWVATGDPEILFIKRSTRIGDRWTGHIALPGGKRELGDVSDKETSMREAREETGIELGGSDCLIVGNLPERVVTSTWGKKPYVSLRLSLWGRGTEGSAGLCINDIAQTAGFMPLHLPFIATRYPPPNAPANRSPFGALGLSPRPFRTFPTHIWKLRRFRAIKQIQ